MTLLDLLRTVIDELDRAGNPHVLSGSLASTYHGEPRATQDIDLVIDPTPASLESFIAHFDRRYPTVLGGVTVSMATPEDTVLAKLEWHRLAGGSALPHRDVVGVLSVNPDLDMGYLRRWAHHLGIAEDLETAIVAAERLS